MLKQYSPEILALRERIKLGNDKLNTAFEQIGGMVHNTEEWNYQMEQWSKANERLSSLCSVLKAMGYEDCLYLNNNGKKSRKCGWSKLGCRVCSSNREYWIEEMKFK